MKHRQHGLPADLNTCEIGIVAKEASDATYAQVEYGEKALSELGYVPFIIVVLDHPDILVSARPEIQAERNQTLIACKHKRTSLQPICPPPNQINLSTI